MSEGHNIIQVCSHYIPIPYSGKFWNSAFIFYDISSYKKNISTFMLCACANGSPELHGDLGEKAWLCKASVADSEQVHTCHGSLWTAL